MSKRKLQRRSADKLSQIVIDCALENANRTIAEQAKKIEAFTHFWNAYNYKPARDLHKHAEELAEALTRVNIDKSGAVS